jgi:carbon monoxide dehydrogenase subunit G
MDLLSRYESRTGLLSYSSKTVFRFVSDPRNFERFIPVDKVSGWSADRDSCSFNVPMAGKVSARIAESEPFSRVVFSGDALNDTNFSVSLLLHAGGEAETEVRVILEAGLNPLLKMVAHKPIIEFLEVLIREIENFRDWDSTI